MELKIRDIVKVKRGKKVQYIKILDIIGSKIVGRQVEKETEEYILSKWQKYIECEFSENDIVRDELTNINIKENIKEIEAIKVTSEQNQEFKNKILDYWKIKL